MSRFGIAGKELMKGNIGNAITALATKSASELVSFPVQPSRWRNGNFFFGVNGADKAFIWGNFNSSLIAYQQCPVVSSIINRMAQATVNGKPIIQDAKKKESKIPLALAVTKLLKRPNFAQSAKQFKAQGQVYKRIYGYCPVLVVRPAGFEQDVSRWRLWNIPPWMLQVQDNPEWFFTEGAKPFKEIRLTYMGQSVMLNPDSIFFLKENQISTSMFMSNSSAENVSLFLPDSKLLPISDAITNIMDSLDSRGSMTRNRGPQWLLTNDSNDSGEAGLFPVNQEDKDAVQNDFLQYGIKSGQRKAIITDAKLKLQTVGFDAKQLGLLDNEIQDAKLICDALNYPPYLLGLVDAKFDNQAIAERNLYTNSIIPDSDSDDEQWAELFGLDAAGLTLTSDFSHLPALQENITEQGRGRWYMNQGILIEWLQDGITYNRWRELLGEDTVPGMDLYYSDLVKMGRIQPPAPTKNPADPAGTPAASGGSSGNTTLSDMAQVQLEGVIKQYQDILSKHGHPDAAKEIQFRADELRASLNHTQFSSNGTAN